MLTFYGYKKCGTSRKGETHLKSINRDYDFIDITLTPPTRSQLSTIIEQSNEPIKKFFNTSGKSYKENNVKDKIKTMSEADMITMLAKDGRLIKRPLVTDGKSSTVGFDLEKFETTWG